MNPPVLIVLTGKYKGKRVKLTDAETVIGRDETAKIRIATQELSRQHCLLIVSPTGVLVRDLGSRNGTFVNGMPIAEETLLKPGDTLTAGPMSFELEGGEPSSKKSTSYLRPTENRVRFVATPRASSTPCACRPAPYPMNLPMIFRREATSCPSPSSSASADS